MKSRSTPKTIITHTIEEIFETPIAPLFPVDRTIEYLGAVSYGGYEKVLSDIKDLLRESRDEEICLVVTSHGGATGTAMSFHDTVRYVLQPNLTTIGSGDVDSSGIIIFLTGTRRYITKNTTLLLHMAGRTFDQSRRYTVSDMESMAKEDAMKDTQYAELIAERSGGRLTADAVLSMMQKTTILSPDELVSYGLADAVLGV